MSDSRTRSTFLVTAADDESAVLRDVEGGQIHTLDENPGVAAEEVLEATLEPVGQMGITWRVVDVAGRRSIPIERVAEDPTRHVREIAADQPVGEISRKERAGEGEIHVITVPDERTDDAATDVLEDETTRERAARLGVDRVEIRAADGVVSVRYLP